MLYRTKEEVEYHKEQDGLQRFRRYLIECGVMSEEIEQVLNESVTKEVNEATKYAEKAPYPAPEDVLRHVYAEDGGDA